MKTTRTTKPGYTFAGVLAFSVARLGHLSYVLPVGQVPRRASAVAELGVVRRFARNHQQTYLMNLIRSCFLASFLGLSPSAWAYAPAVDSQVTSNPGGPEQHAASVQFGPLQDQISAVETYGGIATSATSTTGISLITLPQYPGLTFVTTGAFDLSTSISGGQADHGSTYSGLTRESVWRFDALTPALIGTQGTFSVTFQYSSDRYVVAGNGFGESSFGLSVDRSGRGGNLIPSHYINTASTTPMHDSVVNAQASYSGGFTFGQAFNFNWSVYEAAAGGGGTSTQMTAALWKMEVTDAGGQPLSRFSDYEWHEDIGGGSLYSVASAEMVPEPGSAILLLSGTLLFFRRPTRTHHGRNA